MAGLMDDPGMSTAHQLLGTLGVPAAAFTGGRRTAALIANCPLMQ